MIVVLGGTGPGRRSRRSSRSASDATAPRWWTPGGVPICSASGDQGNGQPGITAVPDGAGGAIVCGRTSARTPTRTSTLSDVNGSGALQWAANGQAICDVPGPQSVVAAVPGRRRRRDRRPGGDGRDPSTARRSTAQRISRQRSRSQWMAGWRVCALPPARSPKIPRSRAHRFASPPTEVAECLQPGPTRDPMRRPATTSSLSTSTARGPRSGRPPV